jgi:hypothetical protein
VNAAAARLRRGLEEFAYHACDALKAKVRFKMDGRWDLGDLLPAAMEQYKDLLKKAKNSANSWNKTELVEELKAHDEQVRVIFEAQGKVQGMVNPSVHYNTWADLRPEEFRAVAAAQRELVELFYCEVCGWASPRRMDTKLRSTYNRLGDHHEREAKEIQQTVQTGCHSAV